MRGPCAGLLLAATVLVPGLALAAGTPIVTADAGVGGVARAGRWMPVRVSVETTDRDLAGELIVIWGDGVVRRDVVLPAPSRNRFDLYVRTTDVRGVVTVQLRSNGLEVGSVDVPVRVVPPEDEVTLCVVSADETDAEACTARVTPDAFPRSMRGLDAVDRILRGQPAITLDLAQEHALERWQAYRTLQAADALTRSPHPPPLDVEPGASARSLSLVAIAAAAYLVLLAVAGSLAFLPGVRAAAAYAAIGGVTVLGCAAALAAGRLGPAATVRVRHATVVQQLGGGSSLSMRGVAEFPAFDAFRLRTDLGDATLDLEDWPRHRSQLDEDGRPVLSGTFGLGSSQRFELDGVTEFAPLAIARQANTVRVTNVSREPLRACRFPEGFSVQDVGELLPGRTVEARQVADVDAGAFSCTLSQSPAIFTDARYPVDVEGSAIVNASVPPGDGLGGAR